MSRSRTASGFRYGVCYYPEHWQPSRHASDIARIADCGFDYVRMGEGAWNYWEPQEAKFQFALFDRVIDLCRKHRVKVILGTPTYAAPPWVSSNYPEVLRWNFERIPMKHGSRRNLNYTSRKYFELSDRLCSALAEHYRDEKQVIGWQLDNEFNCHMDVSYAPSDTIAFRAWLREKYMTLAALNAAWGTAFWSQTYDDWDQIDLPHPTATYLNPSVLLDESRFISDCVIRFAKRQAAILRKANKDWFVTHNALFANIDGPKFVNETLDFFSHDQYPLFAPEGDWTNYAQSLIEARSLSFPCGVLEQQSGPGGQMQYLHRTPKHGEMRLWAWQSIAHGADLLSYFRWRTCPYGSEQHWHGLLDQDDRDNRRVAEAKQVGIEAHKLPREFLEAPPTRAVALLRDFDNDNEDRRVNTFTRGNDNARWINAVLTRHVPLDMTWPGSNWDGYKILLAPHLRIVDTPLVRKMERFARGGGVVVLGACSGWYDRNGHVVEMSRPGPLAKLAGVEIEDWTTLTKDQTCTCVLGSAGVALETFVERLKPTGAKVIATWADDDPLFARAPAITINRFGKGKVIYVGGYCTEDAAMRLADRILAEAKLRSLIDAPPQVEAIERVSGKRRYLCLLNHSGQPQRAGGIAGKRELITGKPIRGAAVELKPYGIALITD